MRERRETLRRSWRRHPVLSAIRLACALGLIAAGVARFLGNDARWLSGALLGCAVGAFACWVFLVRGDEDPAPAGGVSGDQPQP